MRICVIAPTPDLDKYATLGGAHLLLTHLVEEGNDYTNFYSKETKLKILDNGLFEHHVAAPTPEILAKASLVGASVVIAPDVLYDPVGTVQNAKEFRQALTHENGRRRGRGQRDLQAMAVPQASNPKDYLWCYKQLVDLGYEWIGLSILACPKAFADQVGDSEIKPTRIAAYRALKEAGVWSTSTNHHLLGLGSFVDEVEFFAPMREIQTNDSSSPIVHGQRGIRYEYGEVPGGKIQDKLNFGKKSLAKCNKDIISNIAEWRARAEFEPTGDTFPTRPESTVVVTAAPPLQVGADTVSTNDLDSVVT